MRRAVCRIHELSCVYGSSSTGSSGKVVSQSPSGLAEAPSGSSSRSSGTVVTAPKLARPRRLSTRLLSLKRPVLAHRTPCRRWLSYAGRVHPIERLRYLARAGSVPAAPLVREAAAALASFCDDPKGLLTASRRLLDRRCDCAPLVWLAARMLTAADPRSEAAQVVREMDADPTAQVLCDGLDSLRTGSSVLAIGDSELLDAAFEESPGLRWLDGDDPDAAVDADLVLTFSECAGPSHALVAAAAVPAAETARRCGTPVWLVAGVGSILPQRMWDLLSARHTADELAITGLDVLYVDRFVTRVAVPAGLRAPAEAARESTCPIVAELLTP